jgi:hypothetical protein
MRKKALRSLTILTILAVALSVTAWAMSSMRQQSRNQQPQDANGTRRKTLREVAQERDAEVIAHPHSETEISDLHDLAKSSRAIVLGRITRVEPSFTPSGEFIQTFYTLDIQRVLKDTTWDGPGPLLEGWIPPAPLTTPLRFVRDGGVVEVNGHKASWKVKGYELLKEGKDYIFFLYWSPYSKAYVLAGGISGVVQVDDNLRVTPLASAEKVKLKHGGASLETFIGDILKEQ